MYVIYCYTNKINGKKYIGQTCLTLEERAGKNGYRYRAVHAFGEAIKKYGWPNFKGEVLEDGLTLEEANKQEQYWIAELNTLVPNGYNLAKGGNNHEWHEESKRKMSNSMKGKKPWTTGKHLSDETKEKIRQSHLGKKMSDEFREKMRLSNLGKHLTEEHKRLISEHCKGRRLSEETKKRMSEAQKKRPREQNRPYQSKAVLQFTKDGQFVAKYPSTAEVERQLGLNQSNVSACCRGQRKTVGTYIWKYEEVA